MTGVFLQVRLDSSRLPRKALLPLEDDTVVGHAMRALRGEHPAQKTNGKPVRDGNGNGNKTGDFDLFAILTDEESAPELRRPAEKAGFELFVGSKEDVLGRFTAAALHYGVERFIRATGDNPLVSGECARLIHRRHLDVGADYSGFRGLPLGTGVECVETKAILEASREAESRYDREHVCPYLYRHPDRYLIHRPEVPEEYRFPEGRVTLDTEEDYRRLLELYRLIYRGSPIPTGELVRALAEHHPVAG